MMKRQFFLLLIALAIIFPAAADGLGARIEVLDGVVCATPIASGAFESKYEVMLTQMLDPTDPAAGTFEQRVIVMHVGCDRPTVLITQGYDAEFGTKESYRDELSQFFDTNIVLVEHRYFGRSVPEPLDWQWLTAENSAYDLHHIVSLFRQLYPGKWVASGISKGGTTTMLYATYFPGDVDAYVPYVGPVCSSVEDKRFDEFFARLGTPQERDAIQNIQTEIFRRKERLMPGFSRFCEEKGYVFRLPLDEIFDYCVLEYGFALKQWGLPVSAIPTADASDEEVLGYLLKNADPVYFGADTPLTPFFVQAARELGYYPYDLKPFKKYASIRSAKGYLNRIFLPEELSDTKFSKALYRKMTRYLRRNDPKMIMVYGGDDPWTAPGAGWAVTPRKRQMKLYVEPGGSHRARIATLPDADRREALSTLGEWLGLTARCE